MYKLPLHKKTNGKNNYYMALSLLHVMISALKITADPNVMWVKIEQSHLGFLDCVNVTVSLHENSLLYRLTIVSGIK